MGRLADEALRPMWNVVRNQSLWKHTEPVKVERRRRKRKRLAPDRKGSKVVRERSDGVCEACGERRAVHVHHKLGGHGVRGRGPSALPENKLHLCLECHRAQHEAQDWSKGRLQRVTTRIEYERGDSR